MDSVTITEASEQLETLVQQAERGADVTITRDGVVVARLVAGAAASEGGPPRADAGAGEGAGGERGLYAAAAQAGAVAFNRDEIYDRDDR